MRGKGRRGRNAPPRQGPGPFDLASADRGRECDSKRPRAKRLKPLTPGRQRLVVKNLNLAFGTAWIWKKAWPNEWAAFDSTACYALVKAACRFDRTRRTSFSKFACRRIRGALRDSQRTLTIQGWRKDHKNAPNIRSLRARDEELGTLLGTGPYPRSAEATVAATDEVDHWLRKLPSNHSKVCHSLYVEGLSPKETANTLGYSISRVSVLHQEALNMLKDNMQWHARLEENRHRRPMALTDFLRLHDPNDGLRR